MSYDEPWAPEDYDAPYFCEYLHPVVAEAIRQYDFAWPGGYEGPAHIISQDGGVNDHCLDTVWREVEGLDNLRAVGVRWMIERIRGVPEAERIISEEWRLL